MNIQGYGVYTAASTANKKQENTTFKMITLATDPPPTAPAQDFFSEEEEVRLHLHKKYDLVAKGVIQFEESLLRKVARDSAKEQALERVLDSVNAKYHGENNHATASGESLTHYSVEISPETRESGLDYLVETWCKRDDGRKKTRNFRQIKLDGLDFTMKKPENLGAEQTVEQEKEVAYQRYQTKQQDNDTNCMTYQCEVFGGSSLEKRSS